MQIIIKNQTLVVVILKFLVTNLEVFLQSKLCRSVSLQLMILLSISKMLFWAQWDSDPSVQELYQSPVRQWSISPRTVSEPSGTFCDPSTLKAEAGDSRQKVCIGYRVRLCVRCKQNKPLRHKTNVLLLFLLLGHCSPVVFKTMEMCLSWVNYI